MLGYIQSFSNAAALTTNSNNQTYRPKQSTDGRARGRLTTDLVDLFVYKEAKTTREKTASLDGLFNKYP